MSLSSSSFARATGLLVVALLGLAGCAAGDGAGTDAPAASAASTPVGGDVELTSGQIADFLTQMVSEGPSSDEMTVVESFDGLEEFGVATGEPPSDPTCADLFRVVPVLTAASPQYALAHSRAPEGEMIGRVLFIGSHASEADAQAVVDGICDTLSNCSPQRHPLSLPGRYVEFADKTPDGIDDSAVCWTTASAADWGGTPDYQLAVVDGNQVAFSTQITFADAEEFTLGVDGARASLERLRGGA